MDKQAIEWAAEALESIMEKVSEIPTQSGQLEEDLDVIFKLAEEGLAFLADFVEGMPHVH